MNRLFVAARYSQSIEAMLTAIEPTLVLPSSHLLVILHKKLYDAVRDAQSQL